MAAKQAHRGLNRNLLILGTLALLTLGGLALILASRNGGNILNIFQNITNQIIHNSYFTQLIASGATTEKDLQAIAEIRPYGDGFIGISKAQLNWSQASDVAKRTGSEVLAVEDSATGTKQQLVEWLKTTFAAQFQPTLWVRQDEQTKVTDGNDVLAASSLASSRKVALHWKPNAGRTTNDPALATKDQPFENSLGMKFVPVPGTKVLFCIHETRYKDYAAYSDEVRGVDGSWQDQTHEGFTITERGKDHPVTKVNWEDITKFCAWLRMRDGRNYRMPKEHEWSVAVGIGQTEPKALDATPKPPDRTPSNEFPWGGHYPPVTADRAGNYKDMTANRILGWDCINGYDDGFPTTAPVMSFKPNSWGLYDMGGNVWEWCADWWDATESQRVLRGSCFGDLSRGMVQSTVRAPRLPEDRIGCDGFRCVIELTGL